MPEVAERKRPTTAIILGTFAVTEDKNIVPCNKKVTSLIACFIPPYLSSKLSKARIQQIIFGDRPSADELFRASEKKFIENELRLYNWLMYLLKNVFTATPWGLEVKLTLRVPV